MKRWLAFLQSDAGSAVPLLLATVLALVCANSPYDEAVARLLHIEIARHSLVHWIDDGLMVVFFLLVGLEIKREGVVGELSRPAQVALPVAGALGGIVLPAAIYAAFTWNDPAALAGWAIPSATDIAFAVAIVAALGSQRVPAGLRMFLLTLAIVDDLAAIVIIGIFYTAKLSALSLVLAGVCILVLIALNRLGLKRTTPYLAVGRAALAVRAGVGRACHPVGRRAGLLPAARAGVRAPRACAEVLGAAPDPAALRLRELGARSRRPERGDGARSGRDRDCGRPVRRQAARHLRRRRHADRARRGGHAGRCDVAAALWRGRVRRHRLHHEPVHRHPRPSRASTGSPWSSSACWQGSALSAAMGYAMLRANGRKQ
jgi:hypothetical protein